jgi:HIV Tat-specific factor 1
MLKGDGLVTYLKDPSVDLACQILDGAPLRAVGPPLSVTVARFEMKGQQYKDKKGGGNKAAAAGGSNNAGQGGGKGGGGRGGGKGGRGGKKKQFSQAEKQARKLGWGGFDDVLPPERVSEILCYVCCHVLLCVMVSCCVYSHVSRLRSRLASWAGEDLMMCCLLRG